MDREWMYNSLRSSSEFVDGVDQFLRLAEHNRLMNGLGDILCPCIDCRNFKRFSDISVIESHLFKRGFVPLYTRWSRHGESTDHESCSSTRVNYNDDSNNYNYYFNDDAQLEVDDNAQVNHDDQDELHQIFEQSEKPLYAGCKEFSKLSAVMNLMNLKANYGWSDRSFTKLLLLVKRMLPENNELPVSLYLAKKLMCPMGLEIKRIHACPNDCVLYRNEYRKFKTCPVCGTPRYKRKRGSEEEEEEVLEGSKHGPPAKLLWYLPIIPRLKRLFANKNDAKLLRWHSDQRKNDGKYRHVADSPQWRNIDNIYKEFGAEIRNLRFGLSSDGINPFGNMSSRHSTWPVLLCVYNLPPWLCMKRKYIMMSLLIQGPKQPGNDIDVYLAPLIDDLKTLWDTGVDVYDAYKKETFRLRAMIYCTINDFPAYGNLSGYCTKGKSACPNCESETHSRWLEHCKKTVYMGHRRSLDRNHAYRSMDTEFDGTTEHGTVRTRFTGHEALSKVVNKKTVFGKGIPVEKGLWKKKSIFWDLPYWKDLEVRHCLDVMHIEKNVCDSLIGLLLNLPGKTKDGINVRKDMEAWKIRPELCPKLNPDKKRTFLPPASYTLSRAEKKQFCECLHGIKVPSGYSSNIKGFVSLKDCKLLGMKSHDCHVLMTHMIPIAIRGLMPTRIRHSITKLCLFFNTIHSKVIVATELDKMQKEIILTLCELEMYFPPSFFDVMVHLVSHIVGEIKVAGPVFLRYMYPFERYMGFIKGYVRNKNKPEGSIIEGYCSEEVIEFCNDYMEGVKKVGIPISRHEGRLSGVGTIGVKDMNPSRDLLQLAHFVVLEHMSCISPYIEKHMRILRAKHAGRDEAWYKVKHNKEFAKWLKDFVTANYGQPNVDKTVEAFGEGPNFKVKTYEGYDINGYTFYTQKRDDKCAVQNSGVTLIASTVKYGKKNTNNLEARIQIASESYYGKIQEIWELDYRQFTVPVFKCNWVSNSKRGLKVDSELGFTLVNLSTSSHTDEPFVLANLVTQAFYVQDPTNPRWHVVLLGKRRILGVDNVVDEEEYDQFDELPPFSVGIPPLAGDNNVSLRANDDDEGVWIEHPRVYG